MLKNNYRFLLELFSPDSSLVGRSPLEVDWEPALECAEFEAMRLGQLPPVYRETNCTLEPLWHERLGEPLVAGFRFAFSPIVNPGAEAATSFFSNPVGTDYFRVAVAAAAGKLQQGGVLTTDEKISFQVSAFAQSEAQSDNEQAGRNTLVFETEDIAQTLTLQPASLPAARALASATGERAEELLPVFVSASLLDEIAELSRSAGEKETGGILIGHLHSDENEAEIFATVTTQLPAQHTEAELMKLTFTSETWTEVRHALGLRGQDEIMLGWWHSHPARAWCKDCSVESQRQCQYARAFFSTHDRALHRTMFPRAYSLALVVNDVGFAPANFSLFGWKDGAILERDFYVVGWRSQAD